MDVFISWSGERSKTVATALRRLLRQMLQAVNPWLSTEIIAGTRWGPDISGRLESIDFGILCLTEENKVEPWILFEAGAISKKGQSRVIPFLLGMSHDDIDYPLRQFNCCKVSREGALSVVNSLNQALPDGQLDGEILPTLFEKLWPEFDSTIQQIPVAPVAPKAPPPVEEQMSQVVQRLSAIETRLTYWPIATGGLVLSPDTKVNFSGFGGYPAGGRRSSLVVGPATRDRSTDESRMAIESKLNSYLKQMDEIKLRLALPANALAEGEAQALNDRLGMMENHVKSLRDLLE